MSHTSEIKTQALSSVTTGTGTYRSHNCWRPVVRYITLISHPGADLPPILPPLRLHSLLLYPFTGLPSLPAAPSLACRAVIVISRRGCCFPPQGMMFLPLLSPS